MTYLDVKKTFNGRETMTADEIALAMGTEPSRRFQTMLGKQLRGHFSIVTHRKRVNGKRQRVYLASDFETTKNGHVKGTNHYKAEQEFKALQARQKFYMGEVLRKINAEADHLEAEESSLKKRWKSLRKTIWYYVQMADKEDQS